MFPEGKLGAQARAKVQQAARDGRVSASVTQKALSASVSQQQTRMSGMLMREKMKMPKLESVISPA